MNLRSSLACTSSDIARWGLRSVLKRQGGVLPGRIAMKIDPELLSDLASLVDRLRCYQRCHRGVQPCRQQHGAGRGWCPARGPQRS